MPKTKDNLSWEKEFDNLYLYQLQLPDEGAGSPKLNTLKSFIRKTRQQAKQEVLGEVVKWLEELKLEREVFYAKPSVQKNISRVEAKITNLNKRV